MKQQHDLLQFKTDNQLQDQVTSTGQPAASSAANVEEFISPVYPRMFASGMFVNSFSPKNEMESQCIVKAIKAFRANIIIVMDDKR